MKRAKMMRIVFLGLLLALCGRLYYVQILCGDELTEAAYSQQMIPVLQENSKGVIYDRYMMPLTGSDQAYYYLIHKDNLADDAKKLLERMDAELAGEKNEGYLIYRTDSYTPGASRTLQKQHRAYGFAVDVRYGEEQEAEMLIMDLDEMYAGLLQKEDPVFYFLGNAAGGLIHGTGVKEGNVSEHVTSTALVTTLDLELQQDIERIFQKENVTGCAVITDTRTGQVLAMVNRSKYDVNSNLTVERAYPLGKVYGIIREFSSITKKNPETVADLVGLGHSVFDNYPGENIGSLSGEKTNATAVQMSRVLVTLANLGKDMPLTLTMSTVQEESIPCMEITGDATVKLEKLRDKLMTKPLLCSDWIVSYEGPYAIVVHLERGEPETVYPLLLDCI